MEDARRVRLHRQRRKDWERSGREAEEDKPGRETDDRAVASSREPRSQCHLLSAVNAPFAGERIPRFLPSFPFSLDSPASYEWAIAMQPSRPSLSIYPRLLLFGRISRVYTYTHTHTQTTCSPRRIGGLYELRFAHAITRRFPPENAAIGTIFFGICSFTRKLQSRALRCGRANSASLRSLVMRNRQ